MQYRKLDKLGFELSVLGFGAMRMPIDGGDPGNIREQEAIDLIRHAIDSGINYVDTAYNYHKGKSEVIVGKALKDGYRERVKLATKMPVWLTNTYEDFDKYLNEQLEKLDTKFIDFYLIHNLNKKYWEKLNPIKVLDFLTKAKNDGRIKHIGFSFHDEVNLFKEIIDSFDWDFCQIQLNYMDDKFQAGVEGLKYAASKNIPVIIMEPLKGGKLAKEPPEEIKAIWNSAKEKRSPAEWGLRWLYNHPEVSLILSGMGTKAQVDENVRTASSALPNSLSVDELELIQRVKNALNSRIKINCTECDYCNQCPSKIWIPYNFELYNDYYMYNIKEESRDMYGRLLKSGGSASACIECGKCEIACPQGLPIIKLLKDVHELLSK